VGVGAVEAALGIREGEIADETLLDAVVLEPEDGGVFGMSFSSVEKLKAAEAEIFVGCAVVADESLLEEGCGGLGVVGVGGVVGSAESELPLGGDGGDGVVGERAYPGLG
jgi:hypothetical protein